MKENKNKIRICFALLMLLFFLPHIQKYTGFIKEKELKGYQRHIASHEFSFKGWFDRSYQDTMELHLKDSMPLKASFVILRNQLDYSLFKKIYVRDVHIGKEGQFFRYTHYFTYGGNYPGDSVLEKNVKEMKRVQEKLKKKGKKLIFVIAADKLWYYRELLPEGVINEKSSRYYDKYVLFMNKFNCDFIDFNSYFQEMKDTVQTPLFAKGGYHWTEYSGFIAMDSIANYLRIDENFIIDEPVKIKREKNSVPNGLDRDIYDACNLQFELADNQPFIHPKPEFGNKKGKTQAIICGDSFCNAICWNGFFIPYFNDNSTFWYYNREIYGDQLKFLGNVGDTVSDNLLEKSDIYIVLFSAGNLEKFEYNFLKHFKD